MSNEVLAQALAVGVKREKIAQECGVTVRSVYHWENGKHRIPQSAVTIIEYLRRDREVVIEARIELEIAELRRDFNALGEKLARIESMKKLQNHA
ncbi:helix-turn-helix domain-containing protein [Rhodoferax sp. 4810]|uniref:Helix-turn-helix domain-containing protein n=1 Tax=Thiospirillum jenense TaxID=1653858 RepID=A0A839HH50_9GAMM|nr:helix-turn-helix domain-containing protein [Thiospirillum jenense]MBB1074449.1 helix-turn-helix domain-containing protein [Rhodoferax jenense]MBB1125572.1 helix-turn-helix domain-containing protein [Thiospirillum jenense]